jgi:predicted dehydrogenase
MNDNQNADQGFNRRDFLKGGSMAAMMTMLGGVELFAQTNAAPDVAKLEFVINSNAAVIGLGAWGREILNTIATIPTAKVTAICDTYPASLKRAANAAPGAAQVADYKAILENKDIQSVIIATPTNTHKEIALAAIKAGKHVYCEAPIAGSIDDAREIALAAKANPRLAFQAGLQMRSDPERLFLLPFIRSGALGKLVMARSQWHKKTSWRSTSPNPEREKAINWRLDKATSLGLLGEIGMHQVDQAMWYLNTLPTAVTGWGSIQLWNDGRDVPDTEQAVFEFPDGVRMVYDITLANSFDGAYDMIYGGDAAIMMRGTDPNLMLRDSKAWMFKEVDSPLLGWEVYAAKTQFYKDTGIALLAGASKPPKLDDKGQPIVEEPPTSLKAALQNFLRNATELSNKEKDYRDAYGSDDMAALNEELAKFPRRASAGYLEGYHAVVLAVKANEAVSTGKRIELKPDLYELK